MSGSPSRYSTSTNVMRAGPRRVDLLAGVPQERERELGHVDDARPVTRRPLAPNQRRLRRRPRQYRVDPVAMVAIEDRVPRRGCGERRQRRLFGGRAVGRGVREREPVERVRPEGQQVGQVADLRERGLPEQLDGPHAAELGEVELDVLRMPREVRDHEHLLARSVVRPTFAAEGGRAPPSRRRNASTR